MTLTKKLSLTAAVLMSVAGLANAGVNTYFISATGDWDNDNTWTKESGPDADTHPDSDDIVKVNNGLYTVTVASSTRTTDLRISGGGTVVVADSQTLTVDLGFVDSSSFLVVDGGTLKLDTSFFDVRAGGAVVLQGSDPVIDIDGEDLLVLKAATSRIDVLTDATIQGPGSLLGEDPAAAITINVDGDDDVLLTIDSDAVIHGELSFQAAPDMGTGSVENLGLIYADVNLGQIMFADSLSAITDGGGTCGAPNWKTASGATMGFYRDATSLTSAFDNLGTIYVDAFVSVETSGGMPNAGSTAGAGSFNATGTCP